MQVKKAYEITDAKIQFVSLVDKAANLKSFLITKAKDGQANFSTYGQIVAKDAEHHFVTGVVYEPMAEDAHGNYMTEEEITKAAYFFAKSGAKVDLQHNFEPLPGAEVVESWVAKADFSIDGEPVKKGTWLMTVELSDGTLWNAIEKGEITGFSMGGVGNYSEEDVDLDTVEKATAEKKGLFKKLAGLCGFDVVEKGEMADLYAERSKANQFWTAFNSLQDTLSHYDCYSDKQWLESDEAKIREALEDFSSILQEVLSGGQPVMKAIATEAPVAKAGKKLSGKNRETLQGIYDSLGTFLASFDEQEDPDKRPPEDGGAPEDGGEEKPSESDEDKEDKEVTKAEVEKLIQTNVEKALGAQPAPEAQITPEAVQKMVDAAIAKAVAPQPEEAPLTQEAVAKMVDEAVSKAVEPVLKARGVPSALNDDGSQPVQKSQHYMTGIL